MMNKERLLTLATFLRTVPPERFEYLDWVGPDWKGHADLSCGTTACALGWATTIPEFQALGLRLEKVSDQVSFVVLEQNLKNHFGASSAGSLHAAMQLFDLPLHIARAIFIPGILPADAKGIHVAELIEWLVAHDGSAYGFESSF